MLVGLFLALSAYVLAAVLVHEAGHILGGLLCGFRIIAVKVGPVQLQLLQSRHQTFHRNKSLYGSVHAQFRKLPGQSAKWQCIAFYFSGSLANFCAAVLVFPFAIRDTAAANIFAFFILASGFMGAAQLIPFEVNGVRSDGSKMYSLLFNKTKREELIFLLSLRTRFDEIKTLVRNHRFQEVLIKLEELIRGTETIPSFRTDEQGMGKLLKLRNNLQQHLSSAAGPPEAASDLDLPVTPSFAGCPRSLALGDLGYHEPHASEE
jgi:hypothetical protein